MSEAQIGNRTKDAKFEVTNLKIAFKSTEMVKIS